MLINLKSMRFDGVSILMKTLLLMLLAAMAAFVIPFQAIVNGRLGQQVGHPLVASLISFVGGTVVLCLLILLTSRGWPAISVTEPIPWYLYTGGLLGCVFVTSVLMLVPRIGAANVLAAAIVGQLVMSLIVDHWGILGVPRNPVTLVRVSGVLLLLLGTILIQRG